MYTCDMFGIFTNISITFFYTKFISLRIRQFYETLTEYYMELRT